MPKEVKVLALSKIKEIPLKAKDYINYFLNPSKTNFFDPCRDVTSERLNQYPKYLNISEEESEKALKISDDNGFQLHLRRPPNLWFVNNYFDIGLLA